MKLILSGGGIGDKCNTTYLQFAKEVKGGKVLFIPFANDEQSPSEAFDWFKNEVARFNITDIELAKSPKDITKEYLSKFKGIYFSGGNTFLLLSLIKENNLFDIFQQFFNEDIVVMGCSAGASVFSKDINSVLRDEFKIIATDKNYVQLIDTRGFNRIKGYCTFVHYKLSEKQFDLTEQKVQKLLSQGFKLFCIPEESSVVVENNIFKVIGEKSVEIISKDKRFSVLPNQTFSIEDEEERENV